MPSTDPDSPYLLTVNPKLDGLGQLDPSLFGDLYKLLGMNPGAAPRETGSQYTDMNQFLGSSYMLDRLSLNPDKDYRFLGDAAFDTRYASNTVLNQTGARYINGLGSDLDQMRYLIDNAADAQSSLGLKFGVALTWSVGDDSRRGNVHVSGTDVGQTASITATDGLSMSAVKDINITGAKVAAGGDLSMGAGNNINIAANQITDSSSRSGFGSKKDTSSSATSNQGSSITAGGNAVMQAGNDLNVTASAIDAGKTAQLAAGNDLNLNAAGNGQTSRTGGSESHQSSADRTTVSAGDNLLVQGSAVVGDNTVALGAGNNVDIVAATNTDSSWRFKETKKSGLMGTGGIGITVGSSKSTHDLREAGTTQSQSFSTVGSTGGNVLIAAGNQAHIGGADLIAGKDMSLSGSSVIIDPGHDKRTRDETFEQKKSGLTLALSGAVGGAINNAVNSAQDAKNESDGRLAALQATKSVLSGMQAGQAVALDAADSGNTENPSTNAIGVSISLTTQKSKSEQHVRSDEVTGSTLNAGNNLSITVSGKNKGPNSGDIVIAGSQLKAGGDTVLDAKNDILLAGAANTQQTTGKNSSSGGGVGIGIGVGSGGWGISVFANGNSAHGKDKGNGTDWIETTIDSGKTVTIKSGNDTVLDGALVNGNKIVADVGHDLLMRSQQDNNDYDSKQSSVAGGGSFTFGSMSGSAYMSVSQDKMKSRFDSVAEQTGLYAGDGGFDITVGNHTQLVGAVIASTATADKNNLDTGTLGFSDIHNEADFKTEHVGGAFNTGGSIAGQFASNAANALLAGGGNKGHAEGTTQAAVADGSITIGDKDNQKQDVENLSRDTEHANDSISPIFDKEKEQKRLQEIQLIGEVGSQAADVARTQGDLEGRKAAKDPASLEEARQQLAKEGKPVTDAAVAERAYNNASSYYGTGGAVQRGLQAVTGALTALAGGGNLAGALAAASAPELANIIGHQSGLSDNEALIAHVVLGGVVASLQGNSAAAGASGALSGELAARAIKEQMFPGKSNSELSESDKQLISNLATLASGLAGNLTGGNSAGTTAGAQAGKNAAENNSLSKEDEKRLGLRSVDIIDINPLFNQNAKVLDEDGEPLKSGGGKVSRPASSTLDGAKLKDYYRQSEKYGQGGVKELDNGNYRFYGEITPAKTQGEMAGARLVREWDPKTNQTRTWYETLDHSGNVRSVAPKPVTSDKNHHIFDADGNYKGRR